MVYDVIIIGAGPAGITAGVYVARKGLKVLLLHNSPSQTTKASRVDNWPGEFDISGLQLMDKLQGYLKNFAVEIAGDVEVSGLVGVADENVYKVVGKERQGFNSKAVIIATGAKQRTLGIAGEKELAGKGVAYCSVCDAPFFVDKQVAIVGGGNAGLLAVLDLAKYAKKVCLFEAQPSLQADQVLVKQAQATGKLEIFTQAKIKQILGKDKVEAIVFEQQGKTFQQPMEGVFIEIGIKPNSDFLKGFVALNEKAEIQVDPLTLVTSKKGVFACGDVCSASVFKQLIVAAGQGAVAGLSAFKYLSEKT